MRQRTMTKALYTTEQAARIDQKAVGGDGDRGYALMVRAGESAFALVQQRFSDRQPVVVACGGGNNGGDGYVLARCLRRIGTPVTVVQAAEPSTGSGRRACADYLEAGGQVTSDPGVIDSAALLIDALLGAGLSREPDGAYGEIIGRSNARDIPRIAIDVPSGLDGNTGAAFDNVIAATMTITFIVPKVGMYTGAGRDVCGEIVFESLAIDPQLVSTETAVARLLTRPRFDRRPGDSHKGRFGRLMICGGTRGMLGAALLAGRAALRSGAGTVTIATDPASTDLPSLLQPELMSRAVENSDDIADLGALADVLVIGPGTDQERWSQNLIKGALAVNRPAVIDAGALRSIAGSGRVPTGSVLTPHPGEAAALLGCTIAEIQVDRLGAARKISEGYGGICVLKGAGTVVSDGSQVSICAGGNPGMASAGTGDVLSGIIGALLGQGMSAYDAACAGVFLHSTAADRKAKDITEMSLVASDIVDGLGAVVRDCLR